MEAAEATAWATGVLAVVTLVYVVLTARIAQRAGKSAAAAERAAAAAERAVLADVMPLVVVGSGGGSTKSWRIKGQNVGRSAAVELTVTLRDKRGEAVTSIRHALLKPETVQEWGFGQDDSARIHQVMHSPEYVCDAEYRNAFGQSFMTRTVVTSAEDGARTLISTYVRHGDSWHELTFAPPQPAEPT